MSNSPWLPSTRMSPARGAHVHTVRCERAAPAEHPRRSRRVAAVHELEEGRCAPTRPGSVQVLLTGSGRGSEQRADAPACSGSRSCCMACGGAAPTSGARSADATLWLRAPEAYGCHAPTARISSARAAPRQETRAEKQARLAARPGVPLPQQQCLKGGRRSCPRVGRGSVAKGRGAARRTPAQAFERVAGNRRRILAALAACQAQSAAHSRDCASPRSTSAPHEPRYPTCTSSLRPHAHAAHVHASTRPPR